jgi:AraC family transcriptional regulator
MEQRLSTKEDYQKRVNIVIEYINNHLDKDIDLEKLAEISNFSKWHFQRMMKAYLGEVYDTIYARWLPESGEKLRNYHCFEKYINNPDNTPPEKLKTEIYVPIE